MLQCLLVALLKGRAFYFVSFSGRKKNRRKSWNIKEKEMRGVTLPFPKLWLFDGMQQSQRSRSPGQASASRRACGSWCRKRAMQTECLGVLRARPGEGTASRLPKGRSRALTSAALIRDGEAGDMQFLAATCRISS